MAQKKESPLAVIDADACQELERQLDEEIKERFWQTVLRIGELNADKDPDEVLRDVTEVVEEVRRERYERARRAQSGS